MADMAVLKAIVSVYRAGEEKPTERYKTRVKVAEENKLFYPIHTEIFAPKINEINFIPGRTVFVTSEKYRPTNHRPRTALCH